MKKSNNATKREKRFSYPEGIRKKDIETLEDVISSTKIKFEKKMGETVDVKIDDAEFRELSIVAYVTFKNDNKKTKFLIKTAKTQDHKNKVKNEYNALRLLFPLFKEEKAFLVPKPFTVVPANSTIVIEAYPFESLHNDMKYLKYFTSLRSFENAAVKVRLMGEWLKKLHTTSCAVSTSNQILNDIVEFCDFRLKRIGKIKTRQVPHNFRKLILDKIDEQVDALTGVKYPVSYVHGDFGTWNVLSTEDGIMVIDYATFDVGPVCMDYIRLINSFRDQIKNPFNSNKRVSTIEQAFREGYGDLPDTPKPLVVLCEIKSRLTSLFGALFPSKNWKAKYEQSQIIKEQFKWFLTEEVEPEYWQPHSN